jgi:hypothetical protein
MLPAAGRYRCGRKYHRLPTQARPAALAFRGAVWFSLRCSGKEPGLPEVRSGWDHPFMSDKGLEGLGALGDRQAERGRDQDSYGGAPTTRQMRPVGRRRRDAEEVWSISWKRPGTRTSPTARTTMQTAGLRTRPRNRRGGDRSLSWRLARTGIIDCTFRLILPPWFTQPDGGLVDGRTDRPDRARNRHSR